MEEHKIKRCRACYIWKIKNERSRSKKGKKRPRVIFRFGVLPLKEQKIKSIVLSIILCGLN